MKMKAVLITCRKDEESHEYLINEKGELVAIDKIPSLEKLIVFLVQKQGIDGGFKGCSEISLGDRIGFYSEKELNSRKLHVIRSKIFTGPVKSKKSYTEEQIQKYIQH